MPRYGFRAHRDRCRWRPSAVAESPGGGLACGLSSLRHAIARVGALRLEQKGLLLPAIFVRPFDPERREDVIAAEYLGWDIVHRHEIRLGFERGCLHGLRTVPRRIAERLDLIAQFVFPQLGEG